MLRIGVFLCPEDSDIPIFPDVGYYSPDFQPLSHNDPWAWDRGLLEMSACGWALHSILFFVLWPLANISAIYHPLHRDTSLNLSFQEAVRINRYWAMKLKESLIHIYFSKIIVADSTLGFKSSSLTTSWP